MKLTNQTSLSTQKLVITFCLAIIVHFVSAEVTCMTTNLAQETKEPLSKVDTTTIETRGPMTLLGMINIVSTYMTPVMSTPGIVEASASYLASSGLNEAEALELSNEELAAIIEKANHINQLSIESDQYFADEQWAKLRIATAEYLDLVGDLDTPTSNTQLYFYSKACYATSDYVAAYGALVDFLDKEHITKDTRDEIEFDLALISIAINVDNPKARLKAVAANFDSPYHRDAKAMMDHF
jgi:hypothetical protein